MKTNEKWREIWTGKTRPYHDQDNEEFYFQHAKELKILFGNNTISSVLEIGCGNGALYPYLGFDKIRYKGVDFSSSMLEDFLKKHPDVELECADAGFYKDDKQYDLIFSNGLIQYFTLEILREHFLNVKSMMKNTSLFICAGIPWKALRFKYYSRELFRPESRNILLALRAYLKGTSKRTMGTWYNLSDIKECAENNGMKVKYYGSMFYIYRFHAVMTFK